MKDVKVSTRKLDTSHGKNSDDSRLCTPNFEISDTRDSKIDGRSKKNFTEGFIGNSRDWIFDYGIFNHWYCQLDRAEEEVKSPGHMAGIPGSRNPVVTPIRFLMRR